MNVHGPIRRDADFLKLIAMSVLLWPACVADADIIFLSCFFLMAALWNKAGHCIFALWFLLLFIYLFFVAYSQPSQTGCLPYFHTWCGLSANLGCISETCCMRLAENTGRKKIVKNSLSAHHRTTLSGYVFATKAHIDNRKKIVKQQ